MILKSYFQPYLNRLPGANRFTCAGEAETTLADLIRVYRGADISEIKVGTETLSVYHHTGNFDLVWGSELEILNLKTELEAIMRASSSHSYAEGGYLD